VKLTTYLPLPRVDVKNAYRFTSTSQKFSQCSGYGEEEIIFSYLFFTQRVTVMQGRQTTRLEIPTAQPI